jgi:hypothetical protein
MPERGLERAQEPAGNHALDSALGEKLGDAAQGEPATPCLAATDSMAQRIASLPPEALRALQAMLDALTQSPR